MSNHKGIKFLFKLKKMLNQRGQALALYAIAFPILFMFVCVGIDMGWYYLNVSRLQNAAEAASIAGANTLKSTNDLTNVKKILLVDEFFNKEDEKDSITDLINANVAATDYANKNLNETAESGDIAEDKVNAITNSWTHEPVKLVMESDIEKQNDPFTGLFKKNDNYYYQVVLQEDVEHFMMPGWFEPMKAEVTAVAKLSVEMIEDDGKPKNEEPSNPPPEQVLDEEDTQKLKTLKNENVIIGNWEIQNRYRQAKEKDNTSALEKYMTNLEHGIYAGAWNHFQDKKNHYKENSLYRTETVTIRADSEDGKIKTSAVKTSAAINTFNLQSYTYSPDGNPYEWQRVDSLNIDFKQDIQVEKSSKYISEDWDLPLGYPTGVTFLTNNFDPQTITGKELEKVERLRIHNTINIENPYRVRSYVPDSYYKNKGYTDKPDTEYPDVLWVRIESEPMLYFRWLPGWNTQQFNSVRQLIINVKQSNTETETVTVETDGKQVQETRYKYRPMIFFYDGPERYDLTNPIRDSKPVIVNLNVPFRGIIFAPNSPVVVLGKARDQFQGFIVAKEYWELLDVNENSKYNAITENGIDMLVDDYGNVQYKYPDNYPRKYGTYDNFGRTDFSTHGYHVAEESAYNMLFSDSVTYTGVSAYPKS